MISDAMEGFEWDKAFSNKSVDEKVSILTKAILNIMSDFIPYEIVTIDDKDPPWINNKIKSLIRNCVKTKILIQKVILNICRILFKKMLNFLSKSIISNFLENLQLIKSS